MNMRQLKRMHCSRYNSAMILFGRVLHPAADLGTVLASLAQAEPTWVGHNVPSLIALADSIGQPEVAIEKVYKVARVKDNEVVLETTHEQAALDLIEKHVKQKKAKLFILEA